MSPKQLTLEQRLEVACYHASFAKWVVDPTTRKGVCCHCGKPSPDVIFRNCSECGNQFVMPFNWKWLSKMVRLSTGQFVERHVLCPPCNGEKPSS